MIINYYYYTCIYCVPFHCCIQVLCNDSEARGNCTLTLSIVTSARASETFYQKWHQKLIYGFKG